MKKQLLLVLIILLPMVASAQKGGKCGDNVTWSFDKATGTLTIEGTERMYDYGFKSNKAPWRKLIYKNKVKKIVVGEGVTSVGKFTFGMYDDVVFSTDDQIFGFVRDKVLDMPNRDNVMVLLPTTLELIGSCSFRKLEITHITIPNSVTSIGNSAFAFCHRLTSATIPNSVTSIGDGAFYGCSSLTSITIPNSVKSIGDDAFYGCSSLTSITIPNSVKSIGSYTFQNCTGLTSVTIPNNVTSIGEHSFYGCGQLKSIELPNRITAIEEGTFAGCENLTSVSIPNSVTFIAEGAFKDCDKLTRVNVPALANIHANAFSERTVVVRTKEEPAPATPLLAEDKTPAPNNSNVSKATHVQKKAPVLPEIDRIIPTSTQRSDNTFAVVIGSEKYDDEADVPFAKNDAKIFGEYCKKTLGINEKHIRCIYNATYNDFRKAINWLKQGLSLYEGKGRVIFYYAGHGIPSETDMSAYLLPVDGIGSDIGSAYSLQRLYQALSELPAQSVTVFLDACFSGAKRDGTMMASARGVAIKAKPQEAQGKMVIFTAAQGDETAYPYLSQQHGMFTYHLLKKLQETKGNVTLGELSDYLIREVKHASFNENNKMQTPTVSASSALMDSWRNMQLK